MTLPLYNTDNPFHQSGQTWLVELHVPYRAAERFAEALRIFSENIAMFEDDPDYADKETEPETRWKITLYCETKPDGKVLSQCIGLLAASNEIPLPEISVGLMPEFDWVSEVQKSFPSIHVGRYFIHSSGYTGAIPAAAYGITIDAGLAFGTGEHETTKGCLLALHGLAKRRRFEHMLDMGCGTGILSIAMAKTWKKPVVAADLDPAAVRITSRNAVQNNVGHWVKSVPSNGYSASAIRNHAPYDLIVSNILAKPLMKFAPDVRRYLAPGGTAVLSGLLVQQENQVLARHRAVGLRLVKRLRLYPWSVLVLRG